MPFALPNIPMTERLEIEDWHRVLGNSPNRPAFENSLSDSLIPAVTQYLPASMNYPGGYASIADWIADRKSEAQVLALHERGTTSFVGLMLLHFSENNDLATYHVGYFIAEPHWGKGYATEALSAVVSALKGSGSTKFMAGVDDDNVASARVLEKAGFTGLAAESTRTRRFYELQIN